MTNKEEILNKIKKTEKYLANMKKMLEECEYDRWKPKKGKMFYYLNSYNIAIPETWGADYSDAAHYDIYNCFQTREQAEAEAEKILICRQLEDIARRLNKNKKIDWDNQERAKYSLGYDNNDKRIYQCANIFTVRQGTVYCLDENFKDIAIQEIGAERLKKYLRGE